MEKNILYCPVCEQAIKSLKTGEVKHYGYKRMNEPYSDFLKRNDHIDDSIIYWVKQNEILQGKTVKVN